MEDGGAARSAQPISANNPGLCGDCAHARRIQSSRGSAFYQCQLSFTDTQFEKYPRLPVVTCRGYEKKGRL